KEGGRIRADVVDAKTGATCAADVMVTREDAPKDARNEFGFEIPVKESERFERGGLEPGTYAISARSSDGRIGILRGGEGTQEKDPAPKVIRVAPGGKIRLRYEGSKPDLLVTIASEGADIALFGPLKRGSKTQQFAPAGTVTLKVFRGFSGEPR